MGAIFNPVPLGDAAATHVLTGKKFSNLTGVNIDGAMANQGQKILAPGINNIAIPQGYHDGTGYVEGIVEPLKALYCAGYNGGLELFSTRNSVVLTGYNVNNSLKLGYTNDDGGLVTVEPINLTPYTKLVAQAWKYNPSNPSPGAIDPYLTAYIIVSTVKYGNNSQYNARVAIPANSMNADIAYSDTLHNFLELDISSLTGEYYVRITGMSTQLSPEFYVCCHSLMLQY